MRNFTSLFKELDETTQTDFKVEALINYFKKALPGDAAWAVSLLLGKKIKQVVPIKKLRKWSVDLAQIPEWLFAECLDNVGDLAETISLILSYDGNSENFPLQIWIEQRLIPLRNQKEEFQKEKIFSAWRELNPTERYIWNKLVGGSFHMDIPPKLIIKALASFNGLSETIISCRLSGDWIPSAGFFNLLGSPDISSNAIYKSFPFNPAIKLDQNVEDLGDINLWLAEWKWNGIRSQMIKRENQVFIWSHDEDLFNDIFPELYELGSFLPDGTVLDGIIVPLKNNKPLPKSELLKRIVKWYPVKKTLSDIPVSFVAFDLLEFHNADICFQSLSQRRALLKTILNDINDKRLIISEIVECNSWNDLKIAKCETREKYADGLILKRLDSPYSAGINNSANSSKIGIISANWYEWKNAPLTITAVLLYAGAEKGSMSPLFKDYTFALWHEGSLVPFAKTSTGLSDEEIILVDAFIRKNTLEKFGPVRTVKPELVFELEFDGIHKSSRHKSGIVVLSPRITNWHHDKKIEEAGTLSSLTSLFENSSPRL
jgi:DNA ligase-1